MSEKFTVALDIGTSSCRAAAVSAGGRVHLQKSVLLTPKRPQNGLSYYDGAELLSAAKQVLDELLQELGPGAARRLAVTSQRSTVVLWDGATGEVVAPVLTWEDGRAQQEAAQADLPQETVHAWTGLYKTPYFSAPKIAWCLKNVPAAAAALKKGTLKIAPVASYVIWALTEGRTFATDPTLAQRMLLLDISTQTWSEPLSAAFGVPLACLPEIRPSAADYGTYRYRGLDLPICACVGDQQALAAFEEMAPSQACLNYGTGAFLLYNAGKKAAFLPGLLTSLAASGEYLLEAPVNAAGSVFLWLGAQGFDVPADKLDELCRSSKNPVWLLPALGGLGAPYWDFTLSPVVRGLSPRTNAADWAAGAARGIAFLVADNAAYLRANGYAISSPVKVSGGLSQISYLMQFQADLLQAELCVADTPEGTLVGAAQLADGFAGRLLPRERTVGTVFSPRVTPQEALALHQQWQAFVKWGKE